MNPKKLKKGGRVEGHASQGWKDMHRRAARMRDWLRRSASLFRACLFVPCVRDAFRA
jgi:hypothetical protein